MNPREWGPADGFPLGPLDAGYRDVELDVARDQLVEAFEADRERDGRVVEPAQGTIPNAEVHRLDAGHDVAADAPAEVARLVLEWLARLPREG